MKTVEETLVVKNYIGGQWVAPTGSKQFIDVNPANTEDIIATITQSTKEEAFEAIEAANRAHKSWSKVSPIERSEYLNKIANLIEQKTEDIAQMIVREMGKTIVEAKKEVNYAVGIFRFYAGEGRRIKGTIIPAEIPNVQIEIQKESLGVVLVVTPWNFPLSIPAWKIAPALVTGNTVVLKASSETSIVGMMLMEIIAKAGVPEGVVNYLLAPGKVVNELISHPAVKGVTFTGSNNVGQQIHETASKDMKRIQLEMGGKNPLIVLADADLDEASTLAVAGAFGQAGQACTATGKVIVESSVYDEFVALLLEKVKMIKVGNGMEETTTMGPQVSQGELDSTLQLIQGAVEEGAVVLYGGDRPNTPETSKGFFVNPTVLTSVTRNMTIAKEEVFGPVLSVMIAGNLDEAISIANDVEYGLTASICTQNVGKMVKALNELEAGLVKANMTTTGSFFQAPFGGFKKSSSNTFKELGSEGLEFFCRTKTKYIKA
jgi:acyl-CoA reductase-like NAD-dependent aldehyde dehydrogenase